MNGYDFATSAYAPLETAWNDLAFETEHHFDLKAAKDLLGKAPDEEAE